MKTQIPIYRAKKIDSDEYVEGFLIRQWALFGERYAIDTATTFDNEENSLDVFQIDPSTLAIHFPNMLDSEGTKIFASLSEDGRGGDIVEHASTNQWSNKLETKTARYEKGHFDGCFMHKSFEAKVTGIQK